MNKMSYTANISNTVLTLSSSLTDRKVHTNMLIYGKVQLSTSGRVKVNFPDLLTKHQIAVMGKKMSKVDRLPFISPHTSISTHKK